MSDPDIEKLKNDSDTQPVDNSKQPVDNSDNKQGSDLVGESTEMVPDVDNSKKGKNGGARPGAGRKKGGQNQETREKAAVKKDFEERIGKVVNPLFNAQLTLAIGIQYVFRKELMEKTTKKGTFKVWSRFERVVDPDEINNYLNGDYDGEKSKYYMLTVEKPDAKAIDSLLDRYLGRAPQNLNIKDDRPDPIAAVLARFGLLEEGKDSNDNDGKTESSPGTTS